MRNLLLLILLCGSTKLFGQDAPASLPTDLIIPADELSVLDRAELGSRYGEANAAKYAAAHELFEQYFAEPAARTKAVQSLIDLNLEANDLGRLVRIRACWAALSPGTYYINEKLGPNAARYFLGVPAGYSRERSWPLVIALPTADAFVAQPPPDALEVTRIYQTWISEELKRHADAVVLMPLLNLDELWGPSFAGMNSVLAPMQDVLARANIDPARVYVLGHSMSAHAAWNLALHDGTYFASFGVLAGSATEDWQRVRMMNLRNTFPVIWHDGDDTVVPVSQAKALQNLLQHFNVPFDLKLSKGVGHVPSVPIIEERYAMMRTQTRNLYPKDVSLRSTRLDAPFTRLDWLKIDQPTNPGGAQRLLPLRGNGPMTMYQTPFTLEGTYSQNVISLMATNVDLLRIYLNDQMVDFAKPVTVLLNHRKAFEGMLSPSVETMLKDQLILGRGWRYFTASIDLSTTPTTQPSTRH